MDVLMQATDVTYSTIARGIHKVIINNQSYSISEFDSNVTGQASGLFQSSDGTLHIVTYQENHTITTTAINALVDDVTDDAITQGFRFVPTNRERMEQLMTDNQNLETQPTSFANVDKVAGSTFHPLAPEQKIKIIRELAPENDIPRAIAQAVLMPEPTNAYDPEAVQVIVSLTDGSAFVLGYLPKTSVQKSKIKAPTLAEVTIINYAATTNYNNSYHVAYNA